MESPNPVSTSQPPPLNSPSSLRKIYTHPSCVLDRVKPTIRLLTLHSGQSADTISCTLRAHPFPPHLRPVHRLEYEALSYASGPSGPDNIGLIIVNNTDFNIPLSLRGFLQALRLPDRDRELWVDAICIDPSSFEEKIAHLDIAGRVFREAWMVRVWLGRLDETWASAKEVMDGVDGGEKGEWALVHGSSEDEERMRVKERLSESVRKAFEEAEMETGSCAPEPVYEDILDEVKPLDQVKALLEVLAENVHLHELPFYRCTRADRLTPCTEDEESEGHQDRDETGADSIEFNMDWLETIRMLLWLLSRPWWYRVWTLQELILPLAHPTIFVDSWSIHAFYLLGAATEVVKHLETCCAPFASIWAGNYSQAVNKSVKLICELGSLREEAQEGKHVKLNPMLPILFSSDRQTTDERDHIYGILGLMEPGFAMICQQKAYRQTAADLFVRATKLVFYGTGSIKSLSMASAGGSGERSPIPGLPTWAIDFRHTMKNHDPLCEGEERIEASMDTIFDAESMLYELDETTLSVKGIWVGTVGNVASTVPGLDGDGKLSAYGIRSLISEAFDIYDDVLWARARKSCSTAKDEKCFWRTVMRHSLFDKTEETDAPAELAINTDTIRNWWRHFETHHLPEDDYEDGRYIPPADGSRDSEEDSWLAGNTRLGNLIIANWKKHRFFCTDAGEPGLGPKCLQKDDEIFIVKGSPGLLALRPRRRGPRRKRDEVEEEQEERKNRKKHKVKDLENFNVAEGATAANTADAFNDLPAASTSGLDTISSTNTAVPFASTSKPNAHINVATDNATDTAIESCSKPPPPNSSSRATDQKERKEKEKEEKQKKKQQRKKDQKRKRPRTLSRLSETSSFTLVGVCYMDGYMEGQVVREKGDDIVWEDLTLY